MSIMGFLGNKDCPNPLNLLKGGPAGPQQEVYLATQVKGSHSSLPPELSGSFTVPVSYCLHETLTLIFSSRAWLFYVKLLAPYGYICSMHALLSWSPT